MRLEYRDRWPTNAEVKAHSKVYGGIHNGNHRNLWMVRETWANGNVSEPRICSLYPGWRGPPFVQDWPIDPDYYAPIETTEIGGTFQTAPVDADGNAVEWPETEG